MEEKTLNFGEKDTESYEGKSVSVTQTLKYQNSKKAAIKIIDEKQYDLTEADFWILLTFNKEHTKCFYNGLIISHNGCLKINDKLDDDLKFTPECLSRSENCYNNSLIYEYNNPKQKIYEVGEINSKNCRNDYPYAMAFKRCFDRVVLKLSKLAFAGIYSEVEADEFKEQNNKKAQTKAEFIQEIMQGSRLTPLDISNYIKDELKKVKTKVNYLDDEEFSKLVNFVQYTKDQERLKNEVEI